MTFNINLWTFLPARHTTFLTRKTLASFLVHLFLPRSKIENDAKENKRKKVFLCYFVLIFRSIKIIPATTFNIF